MMKNNDREYILEVDVDYPKELQKAHNDVSFLPEKMSIDKCQKLVRDLYGKENMSYT